MNFSFNRVLRNFSNENLQGANFYGSHIENVLFQNCNLSYSNFKMARLENVRFNGCDFSHAELSGASFSNCEFPFCVGNGKEIFSMQIGKYPFVWDRENVFIGCLKVPLNRFFFATTRDEKLLAKKEYKHFCLHKETLRAAILETTGILLEQEKEQLFKGAKANYSSRFYFVEDGLIWLKNTPIDTFLGEV